MVAGAARIRVTFEVDADGLLEVGAREQTTGVEATITVKPSYGLTDGEIAQMLKDSFAHAADDMQARALAEAQVEADRIADATRIGARRRRRPARRRRARRASTRTWRHRGRARGQRSPRACAPPSRRSTTPPTSSRRGGWTAASRARSPASASTRFPTEGARHARNRRTAPRRHLPRRQDVRGARRGKSLLDNLLDQGIDVEHACEKSCACTTCHVIVREGFESLPPSTEDEDDLLDRAWGLTPLSRLSCQAIVEDTKLVVEIPRYTINQVKEGK